MEPNLSTVMADPRSPVERNRGKDPLFDWITSETPAKALTATIKRVVQTQVSRLWENTRLASLYSNMDFMRPYNSGAASVVAGTSGNAMRIMPRQTANLIKVYTDTLAGKLVQSNSRVNAATVGGDWTTFKLARKIDRALDATFMEGDLYREASRVCVDALQTGSGYLYIGEGPEGKVVYERWYYNELFVDPFDAAYGCPTMLFRMRYMKRENALALWGSDSIEAYHAISRAPTAATPAFAWCPYESGMITIYEAWAVNIGKRKGRHILCTELGVINTDQSWDRTDFPVVQFRCSELPLGWYGQGFAHDAAGPQITLNMVLDIMASGAKLGIAPYWTVAGGANITVKQLTNVPGHVVSSDGPPAQWNTNPPFHPSATQYTEYLQNILSIIYGINSIESQGATPQSRYDSNPALVQLQDMWMARHTILLKNWSENFFLEVGKRTLKTAQTIASKKGSYPVIGYRGDRAWALDWNDFRVLKAESYRLKLATENEMPLTPAAKKKMAMQMFASGIIGREKALQMMMGPADLEAATAEIAAYENNADWLIEQLFDGEMPEMSDLQKPDLVLEKIRQAGLMAHDYGAPPEIITNFENFAADVAGKIQTIQQQMMQAQAAQQGAPGGQPLNATNGITN